MNLYQAACLFLTASVLLSPASAAETTSAALWQEFQKTPYTHPNIPNVSFAGYRFGELPLPAPKVVANVRDAGAKADGKTDDTKAFADAIARAKAAGGGAILVPAGTYRINGRIVLDSPNLVLRGEGAGKSILAFQNALNRVVGGDARRWSWSGGLIWIEPAQDAPAASFPAASIRKPAKMGDFVVEIDPAAAAQLKPGQPLQISWTGDLSLCMHIAGHESMRAYDWNRWSAFKNGTLTWKWPNEIVRVDGGKVTLKKPLRLDVQDGWKVQLEPLPPYVTEVGVEGLTLQMPKHPQPAHLKDPGYNGVWLRRAIHCWVRDLTIENCDNGIIVDGSSNCTMTGWRLVGGGHHHGTMCRGGSHDNLLQNFTIESKPRHGLNTEGTSSGNVWRKGTMRHGTFDSHCMMSFDSVRTDIEIFNDGSPGGADDHGPFVGRRIAHWNIRITNGKGEWIAQPAILPMGTIAGIQGAPLEKKATRLWHLPDGYDKGAAIAEIGKAPIFPDLYEAQVKLRLKLDKIPADR